MALHPRPSQGHNVGMKIASGEGKSLACSIEVSFQVSSVGTLKSLFKGTLTVLSHLPWAPETASFNPRPDQVTGMVRTAPPAEQWLWNALGDCSISLGKESVAILRSKTLPRCEVCRREQWD